MQRVGAFSKIFNTAENAVNLLNIYNQGQMMKRQIASQYIVESFFKSNKEDYKVLALPYLENILDLNSHLKDEDVYTIVSPDFYDDIHDQSLTIEEITDKHFLSHLENFKRESFIALHDFYNR